MVPYSPKPLDSNTEWLTKFLHHTLDERIISIILAAIVLSCILVCGEAITLSFRDMHRSSLIWDVASNEWAAKRLAESHEIDGDNNRRELAKKLQRKYKKKFKTLYPWTRSRKVSELFIGCERNLALDVAVCDSVIESEDFSLRRETGLQRIRWIRCQVNEKATRRLPGREELTDEVIFDTLEFLHKKNPYRKVEDNEKWRDTKAFYTILRLGFIREILDAVGRGLSAALLVCALLVPWFKERSFDDWISNTAAYGGTAGIVVFEISLLLRTRVATKVYARGIVLLQLLLIATLIWQFLK